MQNESSRAEKPFFIVGVGRSGTTLIRLMLHSHSRLAIPYESHFITDYTQAADEYGDLRDVANLKRLVDEILAEELLEQWDHDFDAQAILGVVGEQPSMNGVFRAIYDQYAHGKGKARWGDKSDYLDRMGDINRLFPDVQFIHIIRDGRDVANSVMKMTWGPHDLIEAAEWWDLHVRLGQAMGSMLPPERYLEVRYEDLVLQPEVELTRICEYLGEPFEEEMLEYYKHSEAAIPESRKGQHYNADAPPQASRTYAWKQQMSDAEVALFVRYASTALRSAGYEIPDLGVSRLSLEMKRIGIYLKRLLGR